MRYEIKASWTVYYTLRVDAESFAEAREKLCSKDIFGERAGLGPTFGLDEEVMQAHGITAEVEGADGDPSGTGHPRGRSWEYETICEGCAEPLSQEDEDAGDHCLLCSLERVGIVEHDSHRDCPECGDRGTWAGRSVAFPDEGTYRDLPSTLWAVECESPHCDNMGTWLADRPGGFSGILRPAGGE